MQQLLDELNIDEHLTRPVIKKKEKFNKVKSVIPPHEDYNFAIDVLILPETKEKFIGLLVCVDLATDEFDIEPIKNKESKHILASFKTMMKRKHLNEPKYTVRSDAGIEFQGDFAKYLYNKSIYHSVAMVGKHTQNANVERLNRELGRFIIGYLNSIEERTGHIYKEWLSIVPVLREKLNKLRDKTDKVKKEKNKIVFPIIPDTTPKFKVGDLVHRREYNAINVHGKREYGASTRINDYKFSRLAYKIEQVLIYPEPVQYRYLLNDGKRASFKETELILSKQKEQKYVIKKFLDTFVKNKIRYYKVQFKGKLKKDENPIWTTLNDMGLTANEAKEFIDDMKSNKR